MAILTCKVCGENLDAASGVTVCECVHCRTVQALPKTDSEVMANLFNRANNLRLKFEFDKAQEIYEKLMTSDGSDPEAYWGSLLCEFGVEYRKDPNAEKNTLVVCHRFQRAPILTNDKYHTALKYADEAQRSLYEKKAMQLAHMQQDALDIVEQQPEYEVFLCCKAEDRVTKAPAEDSILARDIYHQLQKENFTVFYAPLTLEGKTFSSPEPYIYGALQSAKVFLAVGTQPENFNDVWMKNDWSRFLQLAAVDQNKQLIPCYRDMNAYDLPEAFAQLQAQDMARLGFINDLIREIRQMKAVSDQTVMRSAVEVSLPTVFSPESQNAEERLKYWMDEKKRLEEKEDDIYQKIHDFQPSAAQHTDEIADCESKITEINSYEENRSEIKRRVSLLEHYRDALGFFDKDKKRKLQGEIDQLDGILKNIDVEFSTLAKKRETLQAEVDRLEEEERKRQNKERQEFEAVMLKELRHIQEEKELAMKNVFEITRMTGAIQEGDIITFGSYHGKAIDWLVLEIMDNKMFLISCEILSSKPYHIAREDVTWETCSLRKWLNKSFLNEAFSEEERNRISVTTLENPDNVEYNVHGGNDTEDQLFLLGMNDMKYIDAQQRSVKGWWWLRSPGCTQCRAAAVNTTGEFDPFGGNVHSGRGVRPACWIDLH
ncbi:MAG: DUF6273 domain-containing protein [Ruminococcus sp.]|nr:DUF6273 domain-containing protein [Ruminococcus sp.]